jgi:hypothetical protein
MSLLLKIAKSNLNFTIDKSVHLLCGTIRPLTVHGILHNDTLPMLTVKHHQAPYCAWHIAQRYIAYVNCEAPPVALLCMVYCTTIILGHCRC